MRPSGILKDEDARNTITRQLVAQWADGKEINENFSRAFEKLSRLREFGFGPKPWHECDCWREQCRQIKPHASRSTRHELTNWESVVTRLLARREPKGSSLHFG